MVLKRVLAVTSMVLSVLLVIVLVGGIVGTWIVNRAVANVTVDVLEGIETGLGRAEQTLSKLDTGVGNVWDRVDAFGEIGPVFL